MNIDRARLERELEIVLEQQQEIARMLQQAIGAEKAFRALISLLDDAMHAPGMPEFVDMTDKEKIDA
jgi:hypothetical protein